MNKSILDACIKKDTDVKEKVQRGGGTKMIMEFSKLK